MDVEYILTNKCNLKCTHCIRGDADNQSMNYEDAVNAIDKITAYYKNPHIILSGGEPTVYENFNEIAEYILKNTGATVAVCSNGTTDFFNREAERYAKYSKSGRLMFQISIDGDRQSNDAVRGQGTFEKSIRSLEKLTGIGIPTSVSTTVSRENIKSIDALRRQLEKFKLRHWKVAAMMPMGRASDTNQALTATEWNRFVRELIEKANILLKIHMLYDFEYLDKLNDEQIDELAKEVASKKTCNCGSGNNRIYVYPDMRVHACTCTLDYPFGKINEQSLEQIFSSENAGKMRNYQIEQTSPCRKCRYFKICNGGCKGMSLHSFGRLGVGDTRCEKFNRLVSQNGDIA